MMTPAEVSLKVLVSIDKLGWTPAPGAPWEGQPGCLSQHASVVCGSGAAFGESFDRESYYAWRDELLKHVPPTNKNPRMTSVLIEFNDHATEDEVRAVLQKVINS
jgi:hypothetical protein